jgi:hypothetical protein
MKLNGHIYSVSRLRDKKAPLLHSYPHVITVCCVLKCRDNCTYTVIAIRTLASYDMAVASDVLISKTVHEFVR